MDVPPQARKTNNEALAVAAAQDGLVLGPPWQRVKYICGVEFFLIGEAPHSSVAADVRAIRTLAMRKL